jgi:hypothetical protein
MAVRAEKAEQNPWMADKRRGQHWHLTWINKQNMRHLFFDTMWQHFLSLSNSIFCKNKLLFFQTLHSLSNFCDTGWDGYSCVCLKTDTTFSVIWLKIWEQKRKKHQERWLWKASKGIQWKRDVLL